MANKHKTIYMKQDRFVKKSLFSTKTIISDQVDQVFIQCGDGATVPEQYTITLNTGEKIQFDMDEMTEDSVPVVKFAYRSGVKYEYSARNDMVYVSSIQEANEKIESALAKYKEYGQALLQERFGQVYQFVINTKFKDYSWQIEYFLEKDGVKSNIAAGGMSLCYLSKYDPKAGMYEYALTPELTDEEEWKDTIREDIEEYS